MTALSLISAVTATVEPVSDGVKAALTRAASKVHGRVDWTVSNQVYYFDICVLRNVNLALSGYCTQSPGAHLKLVHLSLKMVTPNSDRVLLTERNVSTYQHADSNAPAIAYINRISDAAVELGAADGFNAHLGSTNTLFDYMQKIAHKYRMTTPVYKDSAKAIVEYYYRPGVTATVEPGYDIKDRMREYGLDLAKATLHNGIIVEYRGNVDLSDKDLTKIPFRFVKVTGYFWCDTNRLTSLAGCPKEVGKEFWCSRNRLTSLAGCPDKVGSSFDCGHNLLTSLAGCPREVGKDFYCSDNHLTSLAGCPREVGRGFYCSYNHLTSLAGCPREVGESFWCSGNPGSASFEKPSGVKGRFVNK